jgi:putative ABC transport system permease protein
MAPATTPAPAPAPGRPAGRAARRIAGQAAGSAVGSTLALALLVCACVFAALAGPALGLRTQTEALQQRLAGQPRITRALQADASWTSFTGQIGSGATVLTGPQLAGATTALARGFAAAGAPTGTGAQAGNWAGLATNAYTVASGAAPSAYEGSVPPRMEVLYRDPLTRYVQVVAGRYTAGPPPGGALPAAVTTQTAARFGLRPGSRLVLITPSALVSIVVTAIVRVRAPASTFWGFDGTAAAPSLTSSGNPPQPYWVGAVLTDPAEAAALQNAFGPSGLSIHWELPLATGQLTAAGAQPLYDALHRAASVTPRLGPLSAAAATVTITSALTAQLASFLAARAAIETILLLLFVSLIVTGAAVIAVAARMITVRRAAELTLLRARGGSLGQVAAAMLRGTAAVSLPAALAGAGLALAAETGDVSSALGWSLAGLVLATALGGPPLIAVWRHRAPVTPASNPARITTADPGGSRRIPARRWVAEAAACAAAVAALVVLHDQGLPAAGQTDLLLAAAPVLVAVPVVLVVLRLYPLAVRGLLRLSARAAGATGFVALARASRPLLTGVLPVFAVALALGVAAFAGLVRDAVARGEVAASWQSTGADVVIHTGPQTGNASPGSRVTPQAEKAIAAVPGVQRAATVWTTGWQAPGGQSLTVLAVDPASYTALAATTPFPRFAAAAITPAADGSPAGPVPVLASPAAAAVLGKSAAKLTAQQPMGPLTVRVAQVLASPPSQGETSQGETGTPAEPGDGAYVIMASRPLPGPDGQPAPQTLLLAGPHIDQAALSAVVSRQLPVATITSRSAILAALAGAPLQHGADLIMLLSILAAAGLGLGTLIMGLALGSADRELTLARLTTMGHDRPIRLALTEAMPAVLAAVAAGLACALALPRLVGPALDLSVFTGTGAPVPLRTDWAALGLPAAALVVIAALALAAETRAQRRRGVTGALRAH